MTAPLPEGLTPDAVDTLTELSAIIKKLRAAQQQQAANPSSQAAAGGPGTTGAPGSQPSSSGPNATAAGGAIGTTSLPSSATTGPTPSNALHSVKELPATTDPIKHKLQRARAAVRLLGDMSRTMAQQEAELARLEERRRKQAAMLAKAQEEGARLSKGFGEVGETPVVLVETGDKMAME
ncbi:uncharacterized protein CTHT_0016410 [Thermochaetoides thermophila DSM 1495]|uniref:Mediator of RNA polymerase II transcription subunit 9 n=1 Tax=Chaetomium thermophilum (strain DSM 1495 / CBS 144.50 / IMI 039719) TaxID=759272 RepID=G0S292_CHATD|nr:hypothetical protein CTHT_0016410 [Thermochaetoides thermophila DSM 1495]EGS22125.1 hypothetical protein CTHT_0016410 [Thermochaetoides thermophila DSM 1495]6XP5_I Chain I, Mediator of RNA polymerase II transcription subunit 9 [Thermochaetoides thermophila DSM 1495]